MASRDRKVLQRLNRQGLGTLTTAEGLAILNSVLIADKLSFSRDSCVIASPFDLHKVNAMFERKSEIVAEDAAPSATPLGEGVNAATFLQSIKSRVSKIVSQILDDDVDEDKSLIEMGIDPSGPASGHPRPMMASPAAVAAVSWIPDHLDP